MAGMAAPRGLGAGAQERKRAPTCCRGGKTAKSIRLQERARGPRADHRAASMQTQLIIFMSLIRRLFAVALLTVAASPAFAADPVFPPGARVGMVPLIGLVRAKSFIGFETEDQGVKVVVADLPAEAYGEVANAFKANPGGTGGVKPESIETAAGLGYYTVESAKDAASGNVRRYSMIVPGIAFSGYIAVQVPDNASKIYTDDAVRQ